jgi:hypothetical protein
MDIPNIISCMLIGAVSIRRILNFFNMIEFNELKPNYI